MWDPTIRYTQRLAEAGAVASVGSKGDSFDNAMVEAFNSLYKAELVRNKGQWRELDDLLTRRRKTSGEPKAVRLVEFTIRRLAAAAEFRPTAGPTAPAVPAPPSPVSSGWAPFGL